MAVVTPGSNANNTINGTNDAGDIIEANGGNDVVNAGEGNDSVYGSAGNDTLNGQNGNDDLFGGTGTDRLFGGAGNDLLDGGAGNDSLNGGDGIDTASFSQATSAVTVVLAEGTGNGTATGTSTGSDTLTQIENVVGGVGNDTITGNSGANALSGGAGADQLSGGVGNDTLAGGRGADQLFGGANNDLLTGGSGSDTMVGGDGTDTMAGGDGNDQLDGGDGADEIYGGGGADSITGGAGNDTLTGDISTPASDLSLNWSAFGPDETFIGGMATQSTGGIDISVSHRNDGNFTGLSVETTEPIFVNSGAGEPFNPNSTVSLNGGSVTGGTATITVGFEAATGSGHADSVSDVTFRIADIDANAWRDVLFIRAYDADGNLIPVTVTFAGVTQTGTAPSVTGTAPLNATDPASSVLVTIPGPVSYIEIDYDQGGTVSQFIQISDIHFTTIPAEEAADSITGGLGDDVIDGGGGNDLLLGDQGNDRLFGGAGDDTLTGGEGADLLSGGDGRDLFFGGIGDTVFGGDGGPDFDTLDLRDFGKDATNIIFDPDDPDSGRVEFLNPDGSIAGILTFTDIETVIPCFTPGTLITTATGPRAIEDILPGDQVLTRDSGFQEVCWIGRRDLGLADLIVRPALRPIRIEQGALGDGLPRRTLLVSPQHRMLLEAARAELLFGDREVLVAAIHLVGRPGITQVMPHVVPRGVSYIHLMCDRHEIVQAEGAWTESFQPGLGTVRGMESAQRVEVLALFPELADSVQSYPAARVTLRGHEARVLLAA